ncbi:MAG: hypothetical protein EOP00_15830 [Pedobacter sp.]|nr:MAG: hypothetical protein EOP00_15830 [Pedobacter sp.]
MKYDLTHITKPGVDKKPIFLFLLVIFSLKFFDATFASSGILKNLAFGFMLIAILISVPYFFKYSGGFVFPIQLIAGSIFISIFMAWYTWGQDLSYSGTTIPFMIWFVFFYLLSTNISIQTIEKVILIYGVIYIILFLFQFTHNDIVYFGTRDFVLDRGVIRIIFPGGGVFILSCFISINKVTNAGKYKYYWLAFALFGIFIIILQVTRQQIFLMLLVYLAHFLKNVKLPYKILTIVFFFFASYFFLTSSLSISKGLTEQQKADSSAGDSYIRVLAAKYFLTDFTPNEISKIFGNGFYNDTSKYGKVLTFLANNYGYFMTDVGLVEVYITFGIFALLGYLLILFKSLTISIPKEYKYLKYYLWMILGTSLTSDFLISFNYLIATVLVLYCYQRLYEQEIIKKDIIGLII